MTTKTKPSLDTTLWACYLAGYQSAVTKQQTRHGGGPNYGTYATSELTDEVAILVDKGIITSTEAKRLARTFGKMEYGDLGLSGARAEIPLRKILGARYNWMLVHGIKQKCPQK